MDKYREAFERKGNIKIFVKLCMFDDSINEYSSDKLHDYTLGFVNGAWWAFQEQQKQIDELQARVDAAIKWVEDNKKSIPLSEWHGYTKEEYADDLLDVLKGEQALKGGEA